MTMPPCQIPPPWHAMRRSSPSSTASQASGLPHGSPRTAPFWAIASFLDNGLPKIAFTDLTLQAALNQSEARGIPASVKMLIAGHVHQFEKLTFTDGRPPQLVFGGGATELDPEITDALLDANPSVLQELGVDKQDLTFIHNIDFGVIEPSDDGWALTIKNADGEDEATFVVRASSGS